MISLNFVIFRAAAHVRRSRKISLSRVSDINPRDFRQFEHQGWQEIASRYHEGFAAVTIQAVPALLDAARVTKGTRILDVACGPGYVAAAAAARGAAAIGVDFSSEMVEEARGRYPGIDFQEGDAEEMSFPDSSLDAQVMKFGLLTIVCPECGLVDEHG